MCGIAGFINTCGAVADRKITQRMLSTLIHRGPDNSQSWNHDNISLGYTRLSIQDLSQRANQPFVTTDGNGILVYNGEVYNFRKLRDDLEKEGVNFKSSSDTEVVLYALHVWGPEKAVPKFNGMFAFAYYNLKAKTLWLGRDRAGIKPLYTTRLNGTIAFASEMKALFQHPRVDCLPDMHAVTTYILEHRLDRWTPFENVLELKPGHLLQFSSHGIEERIYYDLLRDLDVGRIAEQKSVDFEEFQFKLDELFESSVQTHMISDAPVATMCSGGVDSSLIAANAKKYKKDLVAYVIDLVETDFSERERAEEACNHINVELRPVPVSREKYLQLWPMAAYYHDEPIFFRQNMLHMAVAEKVRADGFKVLLCGEGADELFGGYSWQASVYDMWRVRSKRAKIYRDNWFIRLISRMIPQVKPLNLSKLVKEPFSYIGKNPPTGHPDPRGIAAVDGGKRALRRKKMMEILTPLPKIEERAFLARTYEDFLVHLATSLKAVDKMNMAFSIESRVPFLDKRIIDFALHLPAGIKYRKGISKPLLKENASKYFPKELMHRNKIGFGVSKSLWKDSHKILRNGWVENVLKWDSSEKEEIYSIIQNDANLEFQLATLEIWSRIYFDNQKPESITDELLCL